MATHHLQRLVLLSLSWFALSLAATASVTVTDPTDNIASPAPGSLRKAIADAAPGETIQFAANVTGTITLAGAELLIDKNLTIQGPGAGFLAVSGNQLSRVFRIGAGKNVSLSGLTIRDGKAPNGPNGIIGDGGPGDNGGGILNHGNLTISNCTLAENRAGNGGKGTTLSGGFGTAGGAGGRGGAIWDDGSLSVSNCTFSSNRAGDGGVGATVLSLDSNNGGNGGLGGSGGAIYHASGTLTVSGSAYSQNLAGNGGVGGEANDTGGDGGLGGSGGAIYHALGKLIVSGSAYSQNLAGNGGIAGAGTGGRGGDGGFGGQGGAVFNASTDNEAFAISNSTFQANLGGAGGATQRGYRSYGNDGNGGMGGAIASLAGGGGIEASTFSQNRAGAAAVPSIAVQIPPYQIPNIGLSPFGGSGGAIALISGTLSMTNCTVSGNQAGNAGQVRAGTGGDGGGIFTNGTLSLVSCTVAGNAAGLMVGTPDSSVTRHGRGGGIAWDGGTATLRNSIVAENTVGATGLGPDLYGAFTTQGHNLAGKGDGSSGITAGANGDLAGTIANPLDPLLTSVADFGGPTPTQALLVGSPAIGAGDDTLAGTDQRGEPRLVGSHVDIGAFEAGTVSMIFFTRAASTATETGGTAQLNVGRLGLGQAGETVQYATASGSATAEADFLSRSGTLTFAAGEGRKTITVPIVNDALVEGDESFTVTLSAPVNTVLGSQTVHTVTIQSEDVPTPGVFAFALASSTVSETAGVVNVVVSRTGSIAGETIHFATSAGTATAGSDFTTTSGTLTFAAGETQQTITVTIINDALVEANETFTITLSAPGGGASLGAPATHTVTIQSEDVPPTGIIALAQAADTTTELDGTVNVLVVRTNATPAGETVHYATASGTATAGSDFTATSGTLTFAAGETQKTISVPITNDALVEGDETFSVTLSTPGGGATLGATTTSTITIFSDETLAGIISFAQPTSVVSETAGMADISVVRTGLTPAGETVQYATAAGSATAGSDFTTTSGTLTFAAGETQKTVSVPITNDALVEGNETFTLTLSAPGSGASLSASVTHTVTIQSEDVPPSPGVIAFALASSSVAEEAGPAVISVVRTGGTSASESVHYHLVATGNASPGSDYTNVSGTLVFAAGEAQKNITIPVFDDTLTEAGEGFQVILDQPGGGATLGGQTSHAVTIVDHAGGTIGFATSSLRVSERAVRVEIPIVRTGNSGGQVEVHYAVTDGTAASGTDFTGPASGTLAFLAGSTGGNLTFLLKKDASVEGDESFTVTLSAPTGAALGVISTITVTIADRPSAAARYHGIAISRLDGSLGEVTVTTTGLDSFSATVKLAGRTFRYIGQFGPGAAFSQSRSILLNHVLHQYDFNLKPDADLLALSGTFKGPLSDALYDFQAERAVTGTVAQPVPQAGYYTALLSTDTPVSRGYLTATVRPTGAVTLSGVLPDGKVVSQSTYLTAAGHLAFYFQGYSPDFGYFGGNTTLGTTGNLPWSGLVSWDKPGNTLVLSGQNFHGLPVELAGARYVRRAGRALDDFDASNGAGSLSFFSTSLVNPLTSAVTFSTTNRVVAAVGDARKPQFLLNANTGLFTGSFLFPNGQRRFYKGVCLQQDGALPDIAQGFFADPSNTSVAGQVELTASP